MLPWDGNYFDADWGSWFKVVDVDAFEQVLHDCGALPQEMTLGGVVAFGMNQAQIRVTFVGRSTPGPRRFVTVLSATKPGEPLPAGLAIDQPRYMGDGFDVSDYEVTPALSG